MKKRNKNIDSYSIVYNLMKLFLSFALRKVFYRRYTVINKESIPKDSPVIIASNHQNALIDALVLIFSIKRQIVFFARADIFKSKFVASILNALKIAPIFRIRDGREAMSNNSESFDLACGILSRKGTLGIFPEGTHNDKEQIIPLKKGLARMVLQAESNFDFNLNVVVVPVGITYYDYIKPRSEVVVRYGKPMTFTHLKEIYQTNPQQALNIFNKEFDAALKEVAIHVDTQNDYHLIQNLKRTYIFSKLGYEVRLKNSIAESHNFIKTINFLAKENDKNVIDVLDKGRKYYDELENQNISEPIVNKGRMSVLVSLFCVLVLTLGFPFFVIGYILNYLPVIFLYNFVKKKIKDPQFRSSVYFTATALIVGPVFYFLQALIIGLLTASTLIFFVMWPIMIVCGILSYMYFRFLKWSIIRWKANVFAKRNKDKVLYFSNLKQEILRDLEKIL